MVFSAKLFSSTQISKSLSKKTSLGGQVGDCSKGLRVSPSVLRIYYILIRASRLPHEILRELERQRTALKPDSGTIPRQYPHSNNYRATIHYLRKTHPPRQRRTISSYLPLSRLAHHPIIASCSICRRRKRAFCIVNRMSDRPRRCC